MSFRAFIRANRAAIDNVIRAACPNVGSINDNDRREWIANHEGLYCWARSEGVRV